MALSVATATLVGLFVSSLLYGLFVVLLVVCIYVLFHTQKSAQPNHILILSLALMFILNTSILALSFSRVVDAFIYSPETRASPDQYLSDPSQWKEVARTSACSAYIFVADVTLIYRCWIVWSKSRRIVLVPIVLHIATTVLGIIVNVHIAHPPGGSTIFDPSLKPWLASGLALTLVEILLVTSLIIFKICTVNYCATGNRSHTLGSTIQVVIEPGMLYVLMVLVLLVTYASGSNAEYIMIDILNPIIGITFSLLVMRVANRQTSHDISDPPASEGQQAARSVAVAVEHTTYVEGRFSDSDSEVARDSGMDQKTRV